MRYYISAILLAFVALCASAMPVRPGAKMTVSLADGSSVELVLRGDEHSHWWESAAGKRYAIDGSGVVRELAPEVLSQMKSRAAERMQKSNLRRTKRMAASRKSGQQTTYTGQKRGLVILVQFANLSFKSTAVQSQFDDIFNKVGYNQNNHIGSVHDYFYDQSYGQFDLQFDVVGPYTSVHDYSYYGKNDRYGDDQHPAELVIEACKAIDNQVDFSDYDWDGDGEVDQVFIIYAGNGENAGAGSNTIWPHEYTLSDAGMYGDGEGAITLDGTTINTYAVSCELAGANGSTINGIGTACHEFSHCLGYPDFYDTSGGSAWGMDAWDLMDYGSYNGPYQNGEVPAGYTSYERWVAGWLQPTELTVGMTVDALKPLLTDADAYVVYNDNDHNEYYLLENRTSERWFRYYGTKTDVENGMLVLHVDYDANAWYENTPNGNSMHQRMTIIPANNSFPSYGTKSQYANQLFPYNAKDSLTNTSTPKASLFNANTDGEKLMNKGIIHIKKNADKTISFACNYYNPKAPSDPNPGTELDPGTDPDPGVDPNPDVDGELLFYESFDQCAGKGGNDGIWSGNGTGNAQFVTDNRNWQTTKAYGADRCAKFGTSSVSGMASTPIINYTGDIEVTFDAAVWPGDTPSLDVFINDGQHKMYDLPEREWKPFIYKASVEGEFRIKFVPSKRFFLDEVRVVKVVTDGIKEVSAASADDSVYSITGYKMSEDIDALPSGIYIIRGKKIIKGK